MLTIKGRPGQWHIGEPFPTDLPRVVEFQASDDELTLIVTAIMKAAHPAARRPMLPSEAADLLGPDKVCPKCAKPNHGLRRTCYWCYADLEERP